MSVQAATAMAATADDKDRMRAALHAVPPVDVAGNLRTAIRAGKRVGTVLREVWSLQRGPGKLTAPEYFYYRLWEQDVPLAEKARFVGKHAQHAMHAACNDYAWHGVTQDKLLFQATMRGAGLPVPEVVAVVHPSRRLPGARALATREQVEAFLRDGASYPFFAKPIDGVYSLGVVSAERHDIATDAVALADGTTRALPDLAAELVGHRAGALVQERLCGCASFYEHFGDRLCSVRLFVLLTPAGPVLSRAVCKIPVGSNVADNFWRPGNLVGAVDPANGTIRRAVRGSGREMEVDPLHPDTGQPVVGVRVPWWEEVVRLCKTAAVTLPGVRTQSWDVALTSWGPALLEVNWGGDLNLAQLAWGKGALDAAYQEHLQACGFRSHLGCGSRGRGGRASAGASR